MANTYTILLKLDKHLQYNYVQMAHDLIDNGLAETPRRYIGGLLSKKL